MKSVENENSANAQEPLKMHTHQISRDFLVLREVLGRGCSGFVHVASRRSDGKKFALKIIPDIPQSQREIRLQKAADGPYVVRIETVYANLCYARRSLFMVLEYMGGGQLFDRIKTGRLTERSAAQITRDLCNAVAHLHRMNIVHRDIKPENVLYNDRGELKLCDFGFAKQFDENADKPLHTVCYTNYYAPPEILQRLRYDKSCDMWSLGVVMYILLCGYPPFFSRGGGDFSSGMQSRIKAGKYEFPSPEWDQVSTQAKALVKSLLVTNPNDRISIEEMLENDWIRGRTSASDAPLHTSHVLTDERIQEINEAMLHELETMRYSEKEFDIKPLIESKNQILVRRRATSSSTGLDK